MTLNLLAAGIVVLNIAVALALYFILEGRIQLPI
jgi:putative transport protein